MAYKTSLPVFKLFLGIITILIIIFSLGAWLYLRQFQKTKAPSQITKQIETAKTQKEDLEIAKPANESVVREKTVRVIGSTFKKALVSIVNGKDNQIFEADKDGNFEKEFELSPGFNFLTIKAAVPSGDQEAIKNLTLFFSKDAIYQKFYSGSVKGILGKNLTLEGPTGSRTVEVSDSSEVETSEKLTKAEATKSALELVKVSDFVIALGTLSNQEILKGEKIIILPTTPEKTKEAIFGTISKIEEDEITLNLTKTRAKRVFKVDKRTEMIIKGNTAPDIENLVNGDFVGVIVSKEEEGDKALKMIVFPRSTQEATKSGS